MLSAGKQIDADVFRLGCVGIAVERGVSERCGSAATPIFDRRIGVKNLRLLLGRQLHKDAVGPAGKRIVLVAIEIRKQRGCEIGEAIGPCEARIEVAAARGTGDLRHHRIEGSLIVLVGVKSFIQELPQEPSVLRWAECIGIARHDRACLLMFHGGSKIAQCGKANAGYDIARGVIAQLIEMPRRKTAFEIKGGDIRYDLAVLQ